MANCCLHARMLSAAVLAAGGLAPAALTLLDEGRPVAVIVTAAEPSALVRYAVAELNLHLEAMAGAALP